MAIFHQALEGPPDDLGCFLGKTLYDATGIWANGRPSPRKRLQNGLVDCRIRPEVKKLNRPSSHAFLLEGGYEGLAQFLFVIARQLSWLAG